MIRMSVEHRQTVVINCNFLSALCNLAILISEEAEKMEEREIWSFMVAIRRISIKRSP